LPLRGRAGTRPECSRSIPGEFPEHFWSIPALKAAPNKRTRTFAGAEHDTLTKSFFVGQIEKGPHRSKALAAQIPNPGFFRSRVEGDIFDFVASPRWGAAAASACRTRTVRSLAPAPNMANVQVLEGQPAISAGTTLANATLPNPAYAMKGPESPM
jgi:hypothetical protein